MYSALIFAAFVLVTWPIIAITTSCGTFAPPRNPQYAGRQTLAAVVLYSIELCVLYDKPWWLATALSLTLAAALDFINHMHRKL